MTCQECRPSCGSHSCLVNSLSCLLLAGETGFSSVNLIIIKYGLGLVWTWKLLKILHYASVQTKPYWHTFYLLTALCVPACQNNGLCSSPGVCTCTNDWGGFRCEDSATGKGFSFNIIYVTLKLYWSLQYLFATEYVITSGRAMNILRACLFGTLLLFNYENVTMFVISIPSLNIYFPMPDIVDKYFLIYCF